MSKLPKNTKESRDIPYVFAYTLTFMSSVTHLQLSPQICFAAATGRDPSSYARQLPVPQVLSKSPVELWG